MRRNAPHLRWLAHQWTGFWFAPSTPTNLGFSRFLFFSGLLYGFASWHPSAWTHVSEVFWMPITLFRHLHLPVLSGSLLDILTLIWKMALGLSAIGLCTRSSTVIAFILSPYLFGLPQNFGKTHYSTAIIVLIMAVLAASRCGGGWSLDHVIRNAWCRRHGSAEPPRWSGEYTWPIRLIWVLMVIIFFAAGIAKILLSGIAWVVSDNMMWVLIRHHYTHDPPTSWGLYLAQYRWLSQWLALATIVIETGAPLALVSRRLRLLFVPGWLVMQLGIWLLLGVLFLPFLFCYPFWIPWDRMGRFIAAPSRRGTLQYKTFGAATSPRQ